MLKTHLHTILERSWPVALLVVSMSTLQSGASLATTLFPTIGSAGTTSVRLAFSALILLALLRPWRGIKHLTRGSWGIILVYGLALGLMNFLFYEAIARLPLGIAVALEFTGPLTVALFTSRRLVDLLWIGLAIGGLAILLWPDPEHGEPLNWAGVAYALGAATCWGTYILFGQKAGARGGTRSVAIGVTIAAVVIGPIGAFEVGSALLSPSVLLIGVTVAVLSTAVPYTLEMVALPRLPTATFGTLMSLEPAFGALSGLIFLGQQLSIPQWLAVGAIIVASIGTTLTPNFNMRPPKQPMHGE